MFAIFCRYEDANDCDAPRTDPLLKRAVSQAPERGRDCCRSPGSRAQGMGTRASVGLALYWMAVAGGVSYRDPRQLSSRPAPKVVAARCCLGLADRHALFGGHAGVLLDGMKGGDPFKRLGRDRPILKATMAVPGPPRLEERTVCHRRRRPAPEPPSP